MAGLTSALDSVFLDTSVLIAGSIDLGPSSVPALSLLDAVADGRIPSPGTAWHCCLEFYSVTTRLPEEHRLEPSMALRILREEILARFSVAQLPAADFEELLTSAAGDRVLGGRVYDLHIAAVARATNARTVVTDNRRHFTSLLRSGIRVLTAAEMADELTS